MFVYISGAFADIEFHRKKYAEREKNLAEMGYHPVNPVKIRDRLRKELRREPEPHEYIQAEMKALDGCEAINFIGSWAKSARSAAEHDYAAAHGKTFVTVKMLSRNW